MWRTRAPSISISGCQPVGAGVGDCGGAAGVRALPGDTVHPPVVIDYCIQHLGAMVNELDDAGRKAVRGVLVWAACEKTKPYSGTALYSLAEDKRATAAQEGELKRLTLALCKPGVNNVARIAAIKRIKGREDIGTPTAGKGVSLTLRPLRRAVQPHEIRRDSFGGLGAVPPDNENLVGGNNRGFATRS